MMSAKQINLTIQCLELQCKDLNDMHNDYDIPTACEDSAREMLQEAITDFNKSQHVWTAKLINTKKGWKIKYE